MLSHQFNERSSPYFETLVNYTDACTLYNYASTCPPTLPLGYSFAVTYTHDAISHMPRLLLLSSTNLPQPSTLFQIHIVVVCSLILHRISETNSSLIQNFFLSCVEVISLSARCIHSAINCLLVAVHTKSHQSLVAKSPHM